MKKQKKENMSRIDCGESAETPDAESAALLDSFAHTATKQLLMGFCKQTERVGI